MGRPRPSPDRSPCLSRLTFRPLHLQPPHCHFVTVALSRYFTAVTCRVYPPGQTVQVGGMAVARSRVRALPGPSPTGLAESSSLALRIGRSSQVALHPSSRKRSYHCRLQAGNVSLEGTFTLLIKHLHRRTSGGLQAAVSSQELDARTSTWRPKPRLKFQLSGPPAVLPHSRKKLWLPRGQRRLIRPSKFACSIFCG